MRRHHGRFGALAAIVALAGCASTAGNATSLTTQPEATFPTAVFAAIREDPVSADVADELLAILNNMADGSGVVATVMSADGTWSGATGKADGVRDVEVDSQFAVASITKTVIAAQVMQMVEAGELGLDDPATDYLPPLDFDSNGATIRQLLGMRSGIPDYESIFDSLATDRLRRWTPTDVLALVAADRTPAGDFFEYSTTNYVLLGLIIEQVRGRAVADVLRDGVLGAVDGMERLIYQPDETPTEPMAMPGGESSAAIEAGGGYLPSLAGATAGGPGGGMASDSPTLGRWWRAFCAGEIVSAASLTEMATFDDGYGLGLYEIADLGLNESAEPYGSTVGHAGQHIGFVSMAACLPTDGLIVVVLSNGAVDIGAIAIALVDAARSN